MGNWQMQKKGKRVYYERNLQTDSGRVVGVSEENLRSRVGETAARRLQLLSGREQITESEVGQLHHFRPLEEHNVLRLNEPLLPLLISPQARGAEFGPAGP